ncbi:hypothetical protein Daus18300_013502 [Diaporthe australafricana]|uniref:O-methyltransferase domain-containing protein n=1 Tax=Diaporthe australafricana TaxID=127596 RepID=A0ABR3VYQ7_9PEZI
MVSTPASASRIVRLSKVLSQAVADLEHVLAAQGQPTPSFDQDSPTLFPTETDDLRDTALDAAAEIYDLLMEPMALLYKKTGHNNMICLQTITRFGIASMVPADGEVSFAEIASQIDGLSEQMVCRLLRHAMTLRVFREPTRGMVAHTQASKALTNPIMNAWLRNGSHEMWPAAVKGFALANGKEASAFEIIGSDPERAARFATAMSIYATKPEYSASFLTDHYDWASLGPVQVVAVGGGSHLQVLIELARRFDNLEVTLQDASPVVTQCKDAVPAELEGRLHLAAHDLFAPQNTPGDILLLRWTLHLWSNEYCKKILRAQIPALGPNTRMIIQDSCMPEPGTVALWKEQDLRASDIHMANLFNGQERTVQEWKDLLKEADPRFVVQKVIEPKGSALGILEVIWRDTE